MGGWVGEHAITSIRLPTPAQPATIALGNGTAVIDIDKHVVYWRQGAAEDWAVAHELLANGRIRHGLFFAQLALEKLLKAHVCRHTRDVPPRIHNLVRLAELAALRPDAQQREILAEMSAFSLEGRYPAPFIPPPSVQEARAYMERAQQVWEWLQSQF